MSVFRYDLVRTTRRGRASLLRTVYALALLVALGGLFVRWFPGSLAPDRLFANADLATGHTAKLADDFAATCLLVQFVAAVLLTPVYAAGAFAGERQRGTLDAVLVTQLSGAELVFGRFAARWLIVVGLLITGLPVLGLTQLWGGINWPTLAYGFGMTALTTLSLGGLSVLFSVRANSVRAAVLSTYVVAAGLAAILAIMPYPIYFASPLTMAPSMLQMVPCGEMPWMIWLVGYACWHIPLCIIALIWAAWLIRPQPLSKVERDLLARAYERLPAGSSVRVALASHLLVGAPPPWSPDARHPRRRSRVLPVPPIGDDPLLWKELHFGGPAAVGELLRVMAYGLIGGVLTVGLTFILTWAFKVPRLLRQDTLDAYNPVTRDLSLVLLTIVLIGTALRAASTVGRERERHTLESLRVLPAGPEAVITAKWLGSALRMRWLALAVFVVLLVGVSGAAIHPAAVVWLALAGAVHVAFLASLGLFFSVTTANTGRATVATVVGLGATWGMPPVLFNYWLGLHGKSAALDRAWLGALLQEGLSPPLTWRFLSFGPASRALVPDERFAGVMVGLAMYAAAAWVLWRLAAWRFCRQP
jgi:ABC-type transport system involved in multi-copper enzyme maturation permease subunit